MTKHFGAHVSAAGGVEKAVGKALDIGANAFALFVKNQRQWQSKPLTDTNINNFQKYCKQNNFSPEQIIVHDSYLINLAHPEKNKRERSLNSFIDDARRCDQLDIRYLNFHPGSHLSQISIETAIENVVESLDQAIKNSEQTVFVVETTAGQGTNLGYELEQIAEIVRGVNDRQRIGVCLDTCHSFAAGYDLVNEYEQFFEQFDQVIGLDYLKAMHLNDSKKELGSGVDRHASLGKGMIGWSFFKKVAADKRFENIPLILETPDPDLWPREIAALKKAAVTDQKQ